MNVKLAKSAGLCFGVKRAVDLVYDQIGKTEGPIYTYGPIIHNEEVVRELELRGEHVMREDVDIAKYPAGTVIIRSHGVGRDVQERLERAGFSLVDATCPFVLKIHRIVEEYSRKGYHILVVGNEQHPEVQGIIGWIEGDRFSVISSEEDARAFAVEEGTSVCVVSQTTFNYNKLQELVEIIEKKGYDILVLNTICNATEVRQKEAAEIASQVEAMIVIGGRHSSNTQKLFEICKKECADTYYIQTKDDLDLSVLQSISNVGITAGASTPNKIIEEVQKKCQK